MQGGRAGRWRSCATAVGTAALLCIDLDRFREINDTLGPAIGDLLLKACAQRLQGRLRADDRLARISGDEFAIVQAGQTSRTARSRCAAGSSRASPRRSSSTAARLIAGASIGVALIAGDGASRRMPEAAPTSRCTAPSTTAVAPAACSSRTWTPSCVQRHAPSGTLSAVSEDGEFQLHYQPQIDRRHARGRGARGAGPLAASGARPAQAEGVPADRRPDRRDPAAWRMGPAHGVRPRWLPGPRCASRSICRPVQFRHRDLVDLVARALAESGLDPERLELEIPERALLRDTEEAARSSTGHAARRPPGARRLRARLSPASPLPAGSLRQDQGRPRVHRQPRAPRGRPGRRPCDRMHRARCSAARSASRASRPPSRRPWLTTAGCAVLQGYYYSRPIGPREVEALLGGAKDRCRRPHLSSQPTSAA